MRDSSEFVAGLPSASLLEQDRKSEDERGARRTKFYVVDRPGYGGIDRCTPEFRESEASTSAFNVLLDRLCQFQDGIDDVDEAVEFASRFEALGCPCDLIGVGPVAAADSMPWPVRGFDVTWFSHHSFLGDPRWLGDRRFGDEPVDVIMNLAKDHYFRDLNARGLMPTAGRASSFVSVLKAIDALKPESFESDGGFAPEAHVIFDLNGLVRDSR